MTRPGVVTLLGVLQFISAGFLLLAALALIAAGAADSTSGPAAIFVGFVLAAFSVPQLLCGFGLLRLRPYGRILQLVFAWIGLIGFPLGTIISVLILVYLYKPGIKLLFSGKPSSDFSAAELNQIATDTRGSSGVVIAVVALVSGLLCIALIGIIAAIAVPGLLRARQAGNEASAIGTLSAINKAEAAFAATCGSGGYAVTLDDLAKGPAGAPGFISRDLGTNGMTRSGYRITVARDDSFGVIDVGQASSTCNGSSNGTVSSYFASAEPIGTPGARYFATDARGVIYASSEPIRNPIAASSSAVPIQ